MLHSSKTKDSNKSSNSMREKLNQGRILLIRRIMMSISVIYLLHIKIGVLVIVIVMQTLTTSLWLEINSYRNYLKKHLPMEEFIILCHLPMMKIIVFT